MFFVHWFVLAVALAMGHGGAPMAHYGHATIVHPADTSGGGPSGG